MEILKTSKHGIQHGYETSNFKDLMVVRFSAIRIKNEKLPFQYLDKEVQVKFLTTLVFKLILVSLKQGQGYQEYCMAFILLKMTKVYSLIYGYSLF